MSAIVDDILTTLTKAQRDNTRFDRVLTTPHTRRSIVQELDFAVPLNTHNGQMQETLGGVPVTTGQLDRQDRAVLLVAHETLTMQEVAYERLTSGQDLTLVMRDRLSRQLADKLAPLFAQSLTSEQAPTLGEVHVKCLARVHQQHTPTGTVLTIEIPNNTRS